MSSNPTEDERYVECRRHCAFNLPAMFIFVSNSSEDIDSLLSTFDLLTNDHYYMVRRTVACGLHEVRVYIILYKLVTLYVYNKAIISRW